METLVDEVRALREAVRQLYGCIVDDLDMHPISVAGYINDHDAQIAATDAVAANPRLAALSDGEYEDNDLCGGGA